MKMISATRRLAAIVPIAALLGAACGGASADGESSEGSDSTSRTGASAPAQGADTATVAVRTFKYLPPRIEVAAGTTITWTNEDGTAHTVTSGIPREQGVPGVSEGTDARPDGLFDGELTKKGSTFELVLEEPGTFPYFCEIHAGMEGEVVVGG